MNKMIPLWQHEQQLKKAQDKLRLQKIADRLKKQNNQSTVNPFEVLKKMPAGWTGKINVGNR